MQTAEQRRTPRLRRAIEKPTRVSLWGKVYRVTPRLIDRVFGDGRQLIYLCPTNTRPNYYVVRVDSRWQRSNWATAGPTLNEFLDDIYMAIDDQFGDCTHDAECECGGDGCYFPRLDTTSGCEWGEEPWPRGFRGESFPDRSVERAS